MATSTGKRPVPTFLHYIAREEDLHPHMLSHPLLEGGAGVLNDIVLDNSRSELMVTQLEAKVAVSDAKGRELRGLLLELDPDIGLEIWHQFFVKEQEGDGEGNGAEEEDADGDEKEKESSSSSSRAREISNPEVAAYQGVLYYDQGGFLALATYGRCITTYVNTWFTPFLCTVIASRLGGSDMTRVVSNKDLPLPVIIKKPDGTRFKYRPRNDIRLDFRQFPVLLCEIDSNVSLRDERRMLAQVTFLSKVAYWACGHSVVIMAIFFAGPADSSRTGDATVYQAAYNRQKVYFSRQDSSVVTIAGAWQLLQFVSNYAEYLKGIENQFGTPKFTHSLDTIKTICTEGGSLYSSTKRTRSQLEAEQGEDGEKWENDTQEGSSGKRGRKGKGSAIPSKKRKRAAETQESVFAFDATRMRTWHSQERSKDDDDDMDASKRLTPSVRKALRKELRPQGVKLVDDMDEMAAEMLPRRFTYGEVAGRLVAIKLTSKQEVDIHRSLNHVPQPCQYIIPMLGCANPSPNLHAIVIPLRTPLPHLDSDIVNPNATKWMTHLLFGLTFIHDNHIAHLDIRPHNLVVYVADLRLEIIDFGLSIKVRNLDMKLHGFRGCRSWVAPEVRIGGYFYPLPADLWACGRVLQLYRGHLDTFLVKLSNELMAEEPIARTKSMEKGTERLRLDMSPAGSVSEV